MVVTKKSVVKDKRTKKQNKNNAFQLSKKKKSPEDDSLKAREDVSDLRGEDVSSTNSSDSEEEYEKVPRFVKTVKVKNLLPVKNKDGLVFRSHVLPDVEEEEREDYIEEPIINDSVEESSKKNLVERYAAQQQSLNDLKRKVALLCTSLIADPENNMPALRELITMYENHSTEMIVSEKKIIALSLLRVFADILPGYKIRNEEETDKKIKLKKETKKLLGYEQALLKCYKRFIDLSYELIREMKAKMHSNGVSVTCKKVAYEIGTIAVKCLCELLHTKFSFNFYKNIANKLVPLSIDVNENVTEMCTKAFEKVFKADKLGEASYNLVNQIVIVVKERKFNVPNVLLRCFFSLNLREAQAQVEKVDMSKGRKEWQNMSRTERKDKKKIKDLEAELREAEVHESVENVKKFHTNTLNKIFWVYFHILKDGQKRSLIASALEGLSKFAYLINLEFFDDLNSVLCCMMENGELSDTEKLHGVYMLFTILAGQAESLHIDPHKIYCHMYQVLLNLDQSTDVDHFDLVLKCLEYNVLRKRKKISQNRLLAFTKRVGSVCLQTPIHGTLGLLASLRNIFLNAKGADILLDSESTLGSGLYYPEMEDPEHCNPTSTALWELHLLRKHYHPAVPAYANHLLSNCPNHGKFSLPETLAKSSPEEILHLFAEVAVENKIDYMEDNEEPPKKKIKSSSHGSELSFEQDVDLKISEKELKNFNLFANC